MLSRKLLLAAAFTTLASLGQAAHAADTLPLTFGLYQSDKATVMYRKFGPVLEALQAPMEARLNRPVDIELRIHKSYEEAQDALVAGQVDFVRFGPASYVMSKQREAGVQLLAMEHKKGEKRFNGVIIAPAASPLQTLAELKGQRFAFGDPNSTIGRYLAQAELAAAGVHARDLAGFDYLGRHDTVFKAVALGDYAAGSVKESTLKRYNQNQQVRVLHRFPNVTKPWVARAGLDAEVVAALREALLGLEDKAVLTELKASGFLPSSDEEYAFVREGMARAADFEGRD